MGERSRPGEGDKQQAHQPRSDVNQQGVGCDEGSLENAGGGRCALPTETDRHAQVSSFQLGAKLGTGLQVGPLVASCWAGRRLEAWPEQPIICMSSSGALLHGAPAWPFAAQRFLREPLGSAPVPRYRSRKDHAKRGDCRNDVDHWSAGIPGAGACFAVGTLGGQRS